MGGREGAFQRKGEQDVLIGWVGQGVRGRKAPDMP